MSFWGSSREFPVSDSIAVGIERQYFLAQNLAFNGGDIAAQKSLLTSLVLFGQWRFLQQTVAKNDFELQQQTLQPGYAFNTDIGMIWLLSAGMNREQFKQSADSFNNSSSEYGSLAAIQGRYQLSFHHELLFALEFRKKQSHERYHFITGYHYLIQ